MLGEYDMNICVIYLDDLIVFSITYEEHVRTLELIMTGLKKCRLKFVNKNGIETDPDKIERTKNCPRSINANEL